MEAAADFAPVASRGWGRETSATPNAALLCNRPQELVLDADAGCDAIPSGARSPVSPLASKRNFGVCAAVAAVAGCCAIAGVCAHMKFLRDARDLAQQKWSLWDWEQPEASKALGVGGNAVHGRGLIRVRAGLCLHAEQQMGSRVRLGPCGIALGGESLALDQQWQFEDDTGMLRHESAGCLDGGGELLHMWTCDSANPNQVWSYNMRPGLLLHIGKGKCLSAASPLESGTFVDLAECESSLGSAWSVGLRVGQVQLVGTASCLNADATQVTMAKCGPYASMHWLHDPSSGQVISLASKADCLTGTEPVAYDGDFQEVAFNPHVGTSGVQHDVPRNDLLPRPLYTSFLTWGREGGLSDSLGPTHAARFERKLSEESYLLRLAQCTDVGNMSGPFAGQEWNFDVPSGALRLGDLCLEGSDINVRVGLPVRLSECARNDALQAWALGAVTGQLRSRQGICLFAEGASVQMSVCETTKDQSWTYDGTSLTLRILQGLCLERRDKSLSMATCVPTSPEQRWSYDAKQHRYRQGLWCLAVVDSQIHGALVGAELCGDQFMQEWELPAFPVSTTVLACETRNQDQYISLSGVPGRSLLNIGKGTTWEGFVTKPQAYLKALNERAEVNERELIILMDSDVVDGGCTDAELVDRYNRIVAASGGALVVVSADPHQYPEIPGARDKYMSQEFQDRRKNVLESFGIGYHTLDSWEWKEFWYHSYSHLNSGFIMGPASVLEKVMQCILSEGWDEHCLDPSKPAKFKEAPHRNVMGQGKGRCFDDQRALSICAMNHPDVITLDYSGTLMYTSYGMDNPFETTRTGLKNMIVGASQCFVHLNCQDCENAWKWGAWRNSLPHLTRVAV